MLAISICRLEKYLAKIRIKISFIGSVGWNDKNPKSNQLFAPLYILPKTNSNKSKIIDNMKRITIILVFFKKVQLITLARRKTMMETTSQII